VKIDVYDDDSNDDDDELISIWFTRSKFKVT